MNGTIRRIAWGQFGKFFAKESFREIIEFMRLFWVKFSFTFICCFLFSFGFMIRCRLIV